MRVINRACWSNGCHYDKIFAGHQIIFLSFSFVQPMLFHSNQTSYDNRGRFCVVYIETVTSAIMVTPLTMQEKLKELISQYYEVVVQWNTFFCSGQPKFTPNSVVRRICSFNLETTVLMSAYTVQMKPVIWCLLLFGCCCIYVAVLISSCSITSILRAFSMRSAGSLHDRCCAWFVS